MEEQKTESQTPQSVPPQTSTVSLVSQTLPPERKSSRLKSKLPWIIILILLVLVGIFGGYFILGQAKNNSQTPTPPPDQKACSQEAKICPDGVTSVGRTGPKCEFETCPDTPASPSADTSDWEKYTNNNFSISFPNSMKAEPLSNIAENLDCVYLNNKGSKNGSETINICYVKQKLADAYPEVLKNSSTVKTTVNNYSAYFLDNSKQDVKENDPNKITFSTPYINTYFIMNPKNTSFITIDQLTFSDNETYNEIVKTIVFKDSN